MNHGGKARQTVAVHRGRRREMLLGPSAYRFERRTRQRRELRVDRVAFVVDRHRCDERRLVFGTPSALATSALAAQVGVIELNFSVELTRGVAQAIARRNLWCMSQAVG